MTYRSYLEVDNIDSNKERHYKGINFVFDLIEAGVGVLGRYYLVYTEDWTVQINTKLIGIFIVKLLFLMSL